MQSATRGQTNVPANHALTGPAAEFNIGHRLWTPGFALIGSCAAPGPMGTGPAVFVDGGKSVDLDPMFEWVDLER